MSKTDKTTVTFVTYSTRGGVLKLCTIPMMWIGKCVRVVLLVNIMIHSYILVYVYYRTKQRIRDTNSLRTYVVA